MKDRDIIAADADEQRKAERETLGRLNFETYAAARNWTAMNGDPIPQWGDERQPEHIREGWRDGAWAVREALLRMWNDYPEEGAP